MAFTAFGLVSLQGLAFTAMFTTELGAGPFVVATVCLSLLGYYGVVSAKRRPPRAADTYQPPFRSDFRYPPICTDPTANPITLDDVAGRWQFYLDELSKTVILDFRPDGTFAETVVEIEGQVRPCPGGTWTLTGPTVELTGYVTARQGTTESRVWWMVETASGPALFGGDDPQPDAFFVLTRVSAADRVVGGSRGQARP